MARLHRLLAKHTLSCLDDLIREYALTAKTNEYSFGFKIELENDDDFISFSYSTHQSDYPYEFIICYCKQALFDKSKLLYKTDSTGIIPLWRYDKNSNIKIAYTFKEDMLMITDCCHRAIQMFNHFAKLSVDDYSEAYKEYL